jgi:two-component system chemotaxis response regulator CheY
MIVDDSLTVRLYVRQALESLGKVEVIEAQNGIEGLEKALGSSIDLFVVDVNMPKMDGYSFVREVRQRAELRSVPIIIATSEDKPTDRERSYSVGANLHMPKPLDSKLVASAALMLLGGMS